MTVHVKEEGKNKFSDKFPSLKLLYHNCVGNRKLYCEAAKRLRHLFYGAKVHIK